MKRHIVKRLSVLLALLLIAADASATTFSPDAACTGGRIVPFLCRSMK